MDLEKAYDSVEWGNINVVRDKMDFSWLKSKWTMECIWPNTTYILVNGNITNEFVTGRCMMQGDTLYLFFFLIIEECMIFYIE